MHCKHCGNEIEDDAQFCRHCGGSLDSSSFDEGESEASVTVGEDQYTREGPYAVTDPNQPAGFFEAYLSYFLPWRSNEKRMKRQLGGCPGCGEGKNIDIEGASGIQAFAGIPTDSDIRCQRCDTELHGQGETYKVINGPSTIRERTLRPSECSELAAARRKDDSERVQKLLTKARFSHITGDYYWDEEAYQSKHWIAAGILSLLLPPVGIFFVVLFVFGSITTNPDIADR